MTHFAQIEFVKEAARIANAIVQNKKVLEVGSHSVNGEVKNLFNSDVCDYTGIDLCNGPNVDVVSNGSTFGHSESFNIVLACEVFEHNPVWLETYINMIRVAEPGGLVIFTCAARGRLEHGTIRTDPSHSPGTSSIGWNYYKNLNEKDFTGRMNLNLHFSSYKFFSNKNSCDLYFIGQKIGDNKKVELADFYNELEKIINRIKKKSKLKFKTRFRRLPMSLISYIVSDRIYQNMAIKYEIFTLKFLSMIRKLIQA